MSFSHTLSPIKIGNLELKNRYVVPAMGTHLGEPNGQVSQRTIDYYVARVKGGYGLIVTEFTSIDKEGLAFPGQLLLWDDSFIAGQKTLTDAVHEHNGLIFCQLHHAGRETSQRFTGSQPVGASPIPSPTYKEIPRELSTEEVYQLVEKYVDAAVRAKKAGFDGVELHGAHQYVIAQFMSSYSNKRMDEFGGSFNNRMKFPVKIIQRIKEECGQDYPVSIRISAVEPVSGGRKLEESRMVAKALEEAGADVISVSIGGYGVGQKTLAPQAVMPGYNVANAAYIKEVLQVPVIVAGRINDPYLAEDIVASGSADLLALGRTSLADPEFPNKVAENRIDEIIPCVACLQRCASAGGRDEYDTGVSCTYNPFTGKEGILKIEPVEVAKRIAVVGGGPAGLETAWVAAKRGHLVTVFEKAQKPGGQVAVGSMPPHKQELIKAIRAYVTLGEKYGVTFKFGAEANPEELKDFDEIVLATGGVPIRPAFEGIEEAGVLDAIDVIEGKERVGQNVLIIGGGLVGTETADLLGEHGHKVTIMEMKPDVATDEHIDIKLMLLERLNQYGVTILTNSKVKALTPGSVVFEKDGEEQKLEGFNHIILALGAKSYNPLQESLEALGKKYTVIGDALEARTITEAVYEGAKLGVRI
jgi:2,4-dienoyl-CoA reductase-like NADH-dependent reductase (Old Yellow Enzyme family)/thioredoxin reductase